MPLRFHAPLALLTLALSGPALADPMTISIGGNDCNKLVRHVPRADVEYKPGVDVRGKPVASADVNGGGNQFKLPDTLEFPISVSPLGYTKATAASKLSSSASTATIAKVTVNPTTGAVLMDGKPVDGDTNHAIVEECRKRVR